jgi:hypothetical protein
VRVKLPGREAGHSPPSSAEVKNAWSYTSTPQYVFMAWCLVKHRDNFTFTFTVKTKIMEFQGKDSVVKFIFTAKLLNMFTALNVLVIMSHTKMKNASARKFKITGEERE